MQGRALAVCKWREARSGGGKNEGLRAFPSTARASAVSVVGGAD